MSELRKLPVVGVFPHVVLEVAVGDKAATAARMGALVRPFTGVYAKMSSEVAALAEGAVASGMRTNVGSLSSLLHLICGGPYVRPHVYVKTTLARETFPALLADVGQGLSRLFAPPLSLGSLDLGLLFRLLVKVSRRANIV